MIRSGRRKPTRKGPRRARLRPEQRREQLLDVAAEILLASGFDALTMEGVAQRAGVSKGLGYAYFENAEALALALHEREVTAVYHRVEEAMAGTAAFAEQLPRALTAYLDVVTERGDLLARAWKGGRLPRADAERLCADFFLAGLAATKVQPCTRKLIRGGRA